MPASGDQTAPARILIVDDSPTVLSAVSAILLGAGYDVRTWSNIWFAPLVRTWRPDLVLLDVEMGVSDGTIALSALRGRDFSSGAAIVLHSVLPASELRLLSATTGAAGYIQKTHDTEILLREVETYLHRRKSAPPLDGFEGPR